MKMIFVSGLNEIDSKTVIQLSLQRSGYKDKYKFVNFNDFGDLNNDMQAVNDMISAKKVMTEFYDGVEKSVVGEMREQIGNIIVNGFLTIPTKHFGYFLATPETFFKTFKPDVIVLLEMITKDEKINEMQGINRYYGATYSSLCESNLKIIKFRENEMMDAVRELANLIRH